MSRRKRPSAARQLIAQEAARLLAQNVCPDYQSARRKAAARLGGGDQRQLPDNREIEKALRSYQQLFQSDSQPAALERLRRLALEAMDNLREFNPHLTGEVLSGTADRFSPVRLYLFADTPEQLALHLMARRIPFRQQDIRLSYGDGAKRSRALFQFQAGDTQLELILLPLADQSNPPVDPMLERPDKGVPPDRVLVLVEGSQPSSTIDA